ncbi:hypothetical protein KEM54_000873 [Ascosphaera aggregata]|nr:hypothetical protein KEM54_000873 [Ascosphaera aggregata]
MAPSDEDLSAVIKESNIGINNSNISINEPNINLSSNLLNNVGLSGALVGGFSAGAKLAVNSPPAAKVCLGLASAAGLGLMHSVFTRHNKPGEGSSSNPSGEAGNIGGGSGDYKPSDSTALSVQDPYDNSNLGLVFGDVG